ncbi:DNRLRE domain-containing protein [Planotetraspora mira]|uniref:Fibronectin type-III domain-containing protein n=1 Tax=Planotetraspora mira TaxID=58121 RepID=A0A8J3TY28_9ACTN|nr:DNRLRE domain-containing protein [Planotetraspora mira]GII34382.1 hypothetical protein Pmi06nite_78240 [Planotetraspora mira]
MAIQGAVVLASAPPAAAAVKPTKPAVVKSRQDAVSASMAARSQKSRVEVTDERTETVTVWANPDGSFTRDQSFAPIRARKSDGSWQSVDPSLVSDKSGIHPKAATVDTQFSTDGSTSDPVAKAEDGATSVGLGWASPLSSPTLSGATATYHLGVGTALQAHATDWGFALHVVLDKAPSEAPVYRLPLSLSGLKASKADDGSFTLTDKSGKAVFEIAPPKMWDSRVDPEDGSPLHAAPVTAALVDGGKALELRPDPAYLADPATVYPVTVDPDVSKVIPYVRDTYVQESTPTTSYGGDAFLKAGLHSGTRFRSFYQASTTALAGTVISSAQLTLFNYDSGTCSPRGLNIYPITSAWGTGNTWNTQPTITTSATYKAAKSFAHGNETLGCANAADSVDVTAMVKAWADGSLTNYGMALYGATETDETYFKAFCSSSEDSAASIADCRVAANNPKLSVTYNTKPSVATALGLSPKQTDLKSGSSTIFVTTTTPTLTAKATDPDGNTVEMKYEVWDSTGTTLVSTWYSPYVASGAVASKKISGLVQGSSYKFRVAVYDGALWAGPWSAWSSVFTVDASTPSAPTITCSHYTANAWTAFTGAETCTLDTASTDGAGYYWALDNSSPGTLVADTTGTGAAQSITFTATGGWHTLYARARDRASNLSVVRSLPFGVGAGLVLTPADGNRTQRSVPLTARANAIYNQVTYQYRPGNTGAWINVPAADVTLPGTQDHPTWPQTRTDTAKDFTQLDWNVAATMTDAGLADGPLQIQACFQTNGGTSSCSLVVNTITLERTAFGGSYATNAFGPGQVSLSTGDFSVTGSDVSFGELSVSRTHTTLAPPAANSGASGVFGAGWTASLPGPEDIGAADYILSDFSSKGYVTLTGDDGSTLSYVRSGTSTSFEGISDAADGSTLVANTLPSPASFTLSDPDGTTTTWTKTGSTWAVSKVVEPGADGTTAFTRDGNGRVTQMVAPAPNGVTCATLVRGCRALTFTYASSTTATGGAEANWGDYTGLVKSIAYTAWDPVSSAMGTTPVASYLYDDTGHLRASWDPRITPSLKTRYSYDNSGRISTVTPPGLAATTMGYDDAGRVVAASTPDPDNGTATTTVVYDVRASGDGAPIDLSGTTTATWGQNTDLPYAGAAVFPASHVPPADSSHGYAPAASDWKYADLTYIDVNGRQTNTASYGAGAWQIDSTTNDSFGNVVWSLSAGNRVQALAPTDDTDPFVAALPSSADRAGLLAQSSTYSSDGVDLLSTRGPAHPMQLASGAVGSGRVQTSYNYDQGAPTGTCPCHLVTTTVTAPVMLDGTTTTTADSRTTKTGYDSIGTGDTSGWILRQPTSQTTVMPGSTDIVTKTRYDASGRVIESRQPASNGTDAGATLTTYYTAAANATYPQCGNHAEWDGLPCRTGPAAQPTGVTIPITVTVYGNKWGQPTVVTETSGSTARITSTTYTSDGTTADAAGTRILSVAVTTTGITTSPVQTVTTGYDPATGLTTTQSTPDGSVITTGYDSLGRVTSYTDADNNETITEYDIDGKVTLVADGKGTTTYTYDGTDAAGREEHRGLVTSMNTGMGSNPSTFTGAYNPDGVIASQVFPNGMTATTTYDNNGADTTLTYAMSEWAAPLEYAQTSSPFDQVVNQTSLLSAQDYSYDPAGRLTQVQDADASAGTCHTREYTFSLNTNRLGMSDTPDNGDGECPAGVTPSTTHTYDAADRVTDSGYTYDTLGRTLTIPTTDVSGGAPATIGYYANDMVASIAQGGETKTWTLDPATRLHTATDTGGTDAGTVTNHYSDSSDSPAWIAEADGTWTRNITGLSGNLAAIHESGGNTVLQVTNMHGDVVATVDDTTTAVGPDSEFEQTEYGAPREDNATTPARYGWLGGKQRSSDSVAGLTLMGVRLYNPLSGRFLSTDPVVGGNANSYEYCTADPINCVDLDGRFAWVLAVFAAVACTVCDIIAATVIVAGGAYLIGRALFKKKSSSSTSKTRRAAKAKAKQDAKRHNGDYRGFCSKGDHYHCDFKDKSGKITHTKHYRWKHRGGGKKPSARRRG